MVACRNLYCTTGFWFHQSYLILVKIYIRFIKLKIVVLLPVWRSSRIEIYWDSISHICCETYVSCMVIFTHIVQQPLKKWRYDQSPYLHKLEPLRYCQMVYNLLSKFWFVYFLVLHPKELNQIKKNLVHKIVKILSPIFEIFSWSITNK